VHIWVGNVERRQRQQVPQTNKEFVQPPFGFIVFSAEREPELALAFTQVLDEFDRMGTVSRVILATDTAVMVVTNTRDALRPWFRRLMYDKYGWTVKA
jgi:hypothetical protein